MAYKDSPHFELQTLQNLEQRLDAVRGKVNHLKQVTPSLLEEQHQIEVEKFLDCVLRQSGEPKKI